MTILDDLSSINNKVSAIDALNDIEIDLLGIAEITPAFNNFDSVEQSLAIISDVICADAGRLRRAAKAALEEVY